MDKTTPQTANQAVLAKMTAQAASLPAAPASPKGLRAVQLKNTRANYDMLRSAANAKYAQIGKSIECGEYDAARLKSIELQATLALLNTAANKLADLDT